MLRPLLAVTATTTLLASPPRLQAQEMLKSWVSQVLVTAVTTGAADVVADRPGMGAILGIAFSLGQAYTDLRIHDWEIDDTNRGAGLIGPIVIGVGLTVILNDLRRHGGRQGSRFQVEYSCLRFDEEPGRFHWTGADRAVRAPPATCGVQQNASTRPDPGQSPRPEPSALARQRLLKAIPGIMQPRPDSATTPPSPPRSPRGAPGCGLHSA